VVGGQLWRSCGGETVVSLFVCSVALRLIYVSVFASVYFLLTPSRMLRTLHKPHRGIPLAGGKDMLVPKENLEEQHSLLSLIRPGISSMVEFPSAGHLDFTLTMSDDIIAHVLEQIDTVVPAAESAAPRARGSADASAMRPPLSDSLRADARTNPTDAEGESRAPSSLPRTTSMQGPPELLQLAATARARLAEYEADGGLQRWIPAREAARRHPWMFGLTKLDIALEGLDAEARQMRLAPP